MNITIYSLGSIIGLFFLISLISCKNLSSIKNAENSALIICPNCNLEGKDYSGMDLSNSNFNGANLKGANFGKTQLKGVMFTNADLEGANFSEATIGSSTKGETDFYQANLTKANFKNAKIESADFQYAIITCAKFDGINTKNARFGPILYFEIQPDCKPSFQNAVLGCEFPWFWEFFDLEGATLPNCPNLKNSIPADKFDQLPFEDMLELLFSNSIDNKYVSIPPPSYSKEVYVASKGKDSPSCGGKSNPCATIEQGIKNCSGDDCGVLVEFGKFAANETIQLKEGVDVIGGYYNYSPTSYQTSVTLAKSPDSGPASAIFLAKNLKGTVQLKSFILNGIQAVNDLPAASQVLRIDASKLELGSLDIVTVQGQIGDKGDSPAAGNNGGKGSTPGSCATAGGPGGSNNCTASAHGGNGGHAAEITKTECKNKAFSCDGHIWDRWYGGENGYAGSTGYYAPGGPHGKIEFDKNPEPPNPATNGHNGTCNTSPGQNSKDFLGTFKSGIWKNGTAGAGQAGGTGGGGGGGGSGSPYGYIHPKFFKCDCSYYWGTPGGGGGAGGCGGNGGNGGQNGGASIGIVLLNSAEALAGEAVKVVGGKGGTGGEGGTGANGGSGGSGGSGGHPANKSCGSFSYGAGGQGGSGGKGGDGGGGSGGAGGNGGPSICISLIGSSKTSGSIIFYTGVGGNGGSGGAGGAGNGCNGAKGLEGKTGKALNTQQY